MTFAAKPRHLERLAVVVVVFLGYRIAAHGTGFGKKFSSALVHVGVGAGHGPGSLILGQVRVPWAMVPGVRSMARAAVALGQAVVWTVALGASCFHGTDCSTNTNKLQGKSFHKNRGPFFLWASKSVSGSI